MEEKQNRFKAFFSKIWKAVEPVITDLLGSSIVVVIVYLLGVIIGLLPIDEVLKYWTHLLENIFVISALALMSMHTLAKLSIPLIRELKRIFKGEDLTDDEERDSETRDAEKDEEAPKEIEGSKEAKGFLTEKPADFPEANMVEKTDSRTKVEVKSK